MLENHVQFTEDAHQVFEVGGDTVVLHDVDEILQHLAIFDKRERDRKVGGKHDIGLPRLFDRLLELFPQPFQIDVGDDDPKTLQIGQPLSLLTVARQHLQSKS